MKVALVIDAVVSTPRADLGFTPASDPLLSQTLCPHRGTEAAGSLGVYHVPPAHLVSLPNRRACAAWLFYFTHKGLKYRLHVLPCR